MIKQGNALTLSGTQPAQSVNCIVTSPPYYGLRDFNLPPTDWPSVAYAPMPGLPDVNVPAWSGCLGNEPTVEMYVAHLVAIFERLRVALRDDGVAFLNLGDSYVTNPGNGRGGESVEGGLPHRSAMDKTKGAGIPAKNLIGIPWRVAFALQAAGWYLRNDVIWAKMNPMPESVTDRLTKSHEYIFLLAKSPRYWFDQEAIKVSAKRAGEIPGGNGGYIQHSAGGHNKDGLAKNSQHPVAEFRHRRDVFWSVDDERDPLLAYLLDRMIADDHEKLESYLDEYAEAAHQKSDLWPVSTKNFKGAHFATFNSELIEPCILAGCPPRVCVECGQPWRREIIKTETIGLKPDCGCGSLATLQPDDFEIINTPTGERIGDDPSLEKGRAGYNRPRGDNEGQRPITRYKQREYARQLRSSPQRQEMAAESGPAFDHCIRTDTSGARPAPDSLLNHWIDQGWIERVELPDIKPPDHRPGLVLDPFLGSGTTAEVAIAHNRRWLGFEMNPEYIKMTNQRLHGTQRRLVEL